MRPYSQNKTRSRRRSGFTLIELIMALVVLVLATGSVVSALVTSRELNQLADERAIAREAVDSKIEEMKGRDFAEVFALFNLDAADDPVGVPVPGNGFRAGALAAPPGDADGLPGEVRFPMIEGRIREDVVDEFLGMPRDLDFNGEVDADDHSTDYRILPITVRVAWTGVQGEQELTQHYVLTNLQ